MITTLLVWVAKQLIIYFLKTNFDLSRQLDEAVQRNKEHNQKLEELRLEEVSINTDIKLQKDKIANLDYDLLELESFYKASQNSLEIKKKEYEKIINNLTDGDVLKSEL